MNSEPVVAAARAMLETRSGAVPGQLGRRIRVHQGPVELRLRSVAHEVLSVATAGHECKELRGDRANGLEHSLRARMPHARLQVQTPRMRASHTAHTTRRTVSSHADTHKRRQPRLHSLAAQCSHKRVPGTNRDDEQSHEVLARERGVDMPHL